MKFNIKTYFWSGLIMGLLSIIMLLAMPSQVRVPMYNSGAPSPRIIPGICLVGILICSVVLLIQSLVFKKDKVIEFDWKKEKPCIFMILLLCMFTALTIKLGFIIAVIVVFPVMLFYCKERKPPIYIFTIVAGIGIFYLFRFVFHVSLPVFPGFGG